MAPFLDGIGHHPSTSAASAHDALRAAHVPYRVIQGLWLDDAEKRKAGYSACRHRYRFRVYADEVYFFNTDNWQRFMRSTVGAAEMEVPLYIAPGWVLSH